MWEGAVEGTITGAAGSVIAMTAGPGVAGAVGGVALGTVAGVIIDGAVQVGFQIKDDGHVEVSDIDTIRMGKTGLETGLLTLVPCLNEFETDAAMAFGTSLLSGEATVVTSIFDGAITDMLDR